MPKAQPGGLLRFARVDDWSQLEVGGLGVPEPPPDAPAEPLGLGDLVLAPGVAFDGAGYRLGRGGGHYDRTFGEAALGAPILFGLGFDFQVLAAVPRGPGDRRLDAVVTETRLVRAADPEARQTPAGSNG